MQLIKKYNYADLKRQDGDTRLYLTPDGEALPSVTTVLGKTGVSKFRNMWKALQEDPPNYFEAHVQMLDSRWAKQTPNRAQEMARHMSECVV